MNELNRDQQVAAYYAAQRLIDQHGIIGTLEAVARAINQIAYLDVKYKPENEPKHRKLGAQIQVLANEERKNQ